MRRAILLINPAVGRQQMRKILAELNAVEINCDNFIDIIETSAIPLCTRPTGRNQQPDSSSASTAQHFGPLRGFSFRSLGAVAKLPLLRPVIQARRRQFAPIQGFRGGSRIDGGSSTTGNGTAASIVSLPALMHDQRPGQPDSARSNSKVAPEAPEEAEG